MTLISQLGVSGNGVLNQKHDSNPMDLGAAYFQTNPSNLHGSLNVPIEHHPTSRYMVYNGYYKVMSNIPKMGQLPTPDLELRSRSRPRLDMRLNLLA